MFHRKGAAVVAASALLACAGLVRAAEPTASIASDMSLQPQTATPRFLADTGPADASLMGPPNTSPSRPSVRSPAGEGRISLAV